MKFFTRQGRALMLSAAVGAVVAVGLAGCIVDPGESAGSNKCTSSETCRQVTIGSQTWMAENLNIKTADSWCYEDSSKYCGKYGRLYTWDAAQNACPAGWHLPTRDEWGTLAKFAGGTYDYGDGGTAGKALKSTSGWYGNDNGTDSHGFSALPGGFRNSGGSFYNVGNYGRWWSATEGGGSNAYLRRMNDSNDYVNEDCNDVSGGLSVRCLRD